MAATASGVMPSFSITVEPGADAPKRSMPTTSSAYLCQPRGDTSFDRHGGNTLGQHRLAIVGGLGFEEFPAGHGNYPDVGIDGCSRVHCDAKFGAGADNDCGG